MLMVLFSDLSIGQMLAVFAYLWYMMGPVQEVLAIQYAYNGARAALDRINRLMEIDLEPVFPIKVNPFRGKTTVSLSLDRISFRYGDGPLVLNDITLDIRAGENSPGRRQRRRQDYIGAGDPGTLSAGIRRYLV